MLTPAQRDLRRNGIGASDAAAILGFDQFRTPADVLLEKLYGTEESTSEAAEIGSFLEPSVLALTGHRLGRTVIKPDAPYVHPNGVMFATLDGQLDIVAPTSEIVEAKNTGLVADWGDPDLGAEAVPKRVLIQVFCQLACTEADLVHVAALKARFGQSFAIYRVERDQEIIESIEEQLVAWWGRHVLNREPLPLDGPAPSLEVLKRVQRVPNKIVSLPTELVRAWREDDAATKAAVEKSDASKARVLAELGDAEQGDSEIGTVKYLEQARKEYTVAASKSRVCRFTAAKGAKP